MAKKKFTQLPVADALTGDEVLAVVQDGTSKQTTAQDVVDLASGVNEVGFSDLSTAGGALDLNFGDQWIMFFRGQSSFSTAKNVTLSNTSNAYKFDFSFTIGSVSATLTFPSGFIGDTSDTRWDSALHKWTSDATGKFRVTGTFDGIDWFLEFIKAPYA